MAGDTTTSSNDLSFPASTCPGVTYQRGAGSDDDAYLFQPVDTGTYTFTLTSEAGFDPVLYVVGDCDDVAASCLGAADVGYGGDGEVLDVALVGGQTYWVVVDGWNNSTPEDGAYTLAAAASCVADCSGRVCGDSCGVSCGSCGAGETCTPAGQCQATGTGGETCDAPFEIGSLPFEVLDYDTTTASNDVSAPSGSCPGESYAVGGGSPDHVYRLVAPTSGTYTFSVSTNFDPALYAYTTCGDVGGSCLGVVDDAGFDDELVLQLTSGDEVFFVVDGWSNSTSQEGVYDLLVTGP